MASTRGGVAPGPGRAPPVAPTRTPPPPGPNAYTGEYGPELGRVIALLHAAPLRCPHTVTPLYYYYITVLYDQQ